MTTHFANLLFDLDGTLTDPKEGILESIRFGLSRLGWTELPSDEDLMWCIGPPFRESMGKLLKTDDPDKIENAVAIYRERFGTVGLFENRVYDGIPEALSALGEAGYGLLVATSKPTYYAEKILERLDLARFFGGVYGAEMDGSRGTKADQIAHLLDSERLSPAECLMIGDRRHDVEGAAAHGIPCLGVAWGYGSKEELLGAGAVGVCPTPGELPRIVAGL